MKNVLIALAASALFIAGCGGRSVMPTGNAAGPVPGSAGKIVRTVASLTITELPVPQPSSGPTGVTTGPDGNIWFTEYYDNSIATYIISTGKFKRFHLSEVNARPAGIVTGPDGNLWFTESLADKIGRITTAGVITEYPLAVAGSDPIGIMSGPVGKLWFTELDGNKIAAISPQTGKIREFTIPTAHSHPAFITTGADGRTIWFTENTAGKIASFNARGFREFPLASGAAPEGIVTGPDGNEWFTDDALSQVGSITPAGVITVYPTLTPGAVPSRITVGPSDMGPAALWFTEMNANNIGEVTTGGVVSEFAIPTPASLVTGIALGPSNTLYFTEHTANQLGLVTGI
jgi:virginiamycin B lyase